MKVGSLPQRSADSAELPLLLVPRLEGGLCSQTSQTENGVPAGALQAACCPWCQEGCAATLESTLFSHLFLLHRSFFPPFLHCLSSSLNEFPSPWLGSPLGADFRNSSCHHLILRTPFSGGDGPACPRAASQGGLRVNKGWRRYL